MKKSCKSGFTLIELMIVVAIIGILAAIAIPQFTQMISKSKEGTTKGNLGTLRSAVSIYYGDNAGEFPYDDLSSLTATQKYLQIIPVVELPLTSNSPGHPLVSGVRAGTIPAVITDVLGGVNGWVYDNTGDSSSTWGTVLVNCTHQDMKGSVWTSF